MYSAYIQKCQESLLTQEAEKARKTAQFENRELEVSLLLLQKLPKLITVDCHTKDSESNAP